MSNGADNVAQNVLWNRLISVCEEQANALMRAAFGTIVREAGDLSAGVFDARGDMLARAVTGTPGHVNTMAASVRQMLRRVPPETLQPGDALVTNDPWLGAGHVFDFVVVTPAFIEGRIVGYLASTSHIVDVGGRGWSAEGRSIFEEGITIPVMRLRTGQRLNKDLLDIVAMNSRVPHEARGINCPLTYSAACAAFGIRALLTPDIPNNQASLEAIRITAPPGLVLSAERPSPVSARHVIGQALPDLMLGCLEQALTGRVLAESSGALWTMSLSCLGAHAFTSLNVALGGMGARSGLDGLSTTVFPSGVGAVPVEAAEVAAPLIYHSKEFASGTTGPADRQGGGAGGKRVVTLSKGTRITDKGIYTIPAGERVILQTPGGGGFGNPTQRDRDAVAQDLSDGLISSEAAATHYNYKATGRKSK